MTTSVDPAAVWRLWTDVPGWPTWNADLASAEIDGPFQFDARITMRPREGDPVHLRIADVAAGTMFLDEADLGDLVVRTTHLLSPAADGHVLVTYRMEITGADAAAVGPAISGDFPDVLAALVARAAR